MAKAGQSATVGIRAPVRYGTVPEPARFRLAAIGRAGGKGFRLRNVATAPLEALEAEAFDGSGKRLIHRAYGPLPSGTSDLALTFRDVSASGGPAFLKLRSGSRSVTSRFIGIGP